MKKVWMSLLPLLLLAPRTNAQVPVAAGYAPLFKASAGYSFARMNVPSLGGLNMHGAEGGLTVDFRPRFGVELDLSYVRASDAFGTKHTADLFTYMGGPVFYAHRGRRLDVYVHGLFGAARETGVNFNDNGQLLVGFVNRFAWAMGGGAEYKLDEKLSVRFGGDYLNTEFFTPEVTFQRQSNVRAFAGFSYRFGGHRR